MVANQLDQVDLGYRRADNCFLALDDVERTQQIMDGMVSLPWRRILDQFVTTVNPVLDVIADQASASYHWSLHQCEFATDLMFKRADDLATLYPSLARYAIADLGSRDTMRFLGKRLVETFRGEVVTNYKHRPEGICVRHATCGNSIKMYDKQGSVLRIETTTNKPGEFKRRRRAQGNPDSERKLRPLRKGVADMKPRAKVSADANARYLDALSTVDCDRKLDDILDKVRQRVDLGDRRVRALRPWSNPEIDLLRLINRGEFVANGFRNRDILPLVTTTDLADPDGRRKAAAKLSRHLRILCAHGVIRRVQGTHRYVVTASGRLLIAAVVAALDASVSKLRQCA